MDIYMGNPRSTVCQLAVRDNVDKYIEESEYENIQYYKDHFLLMSERDGYNHIYLYDMNGHLVKQLTKGNFVVNSLYGYDEKEGVCYYAATDGGPLRTAVYRTDLKGKVEKLTPQSGQNSAIFSTNMKYFINIYSNLNTPPVYSLRTSEGKELKVMIDNKALQNKVAGINMGTKELFTFRTSEGVELNGWMVKPADFSASKKYPVVMFQYSGPGNQQVTDSWGIGDMGGGLYESYLAQKGFIVVCVDGRGTGGRGAAFERCTYLNLGDLESKDQVETAIYLGSLPYVDKDNIGIWGWSYGGFNTLMSMSEGRGVFKCGVAVAPPTCYRYYDTVYTERYMRTPKENPTGYDRNPITRADKLHGNLLICHGLADDNVHFRNTAEYSEALVQADKQFEMAVYTNRNHGIFGGNTRNHLFTRITNFFERNLK
jgi:dipeptidyl-peptidase-4